MALREFKPLVNYESQQSKSRPRAHKLRQLDPLTV